MKERLWSVWPTPIVLATCKLHLYEQWDTETADMLGCVMELGSFHGGLLEVSPKSQVHGNPNCSNGSAHGAEWIF